MKDLAISNLKLPKDISEKTKGYRWDKVIIGCSKSQIYKLISENQPNLFLKMHRKELFSSLENEKVIYEWCKDKIPVPRVIYYKNEKTKEFLLLSEIKGKVAYSAKNEEEKIRNIGILAEGLKLIHSLDITNCPIDNSPRKLLKVAKKRLNMEVIDNKKFDPRWKKYKPKELFRIIKNRIPKKYNLVFTHGDYCLPNIIIENGKLSGFVDMINAGINDKYFDIAAVVWSIVYNFEEKKYVDLFLQKYGIDVKEVDWDRIEFYQMLNEFLI